MPCLVLRAFLFITVALLLADPSLLGADAQAETLGEARARFDQQRRTDGASDFIVLTPPRWRTLSAFISTALQHAHHDLEALFGAMPRPLVTVRVLEMEDFFILTRAPRWTNALYFRGEILIPLEQRATIDLEELRKTVRHEYSHAALATLTDHRTPGWFDEGVAQLMEGPTHPLLLEALDTWLRSNRPISLDRLAKGFTKLPEAEVPAAYAQSLVLVKALSVAYGQRGLRVFLERVAARDSSADAGRLAFNLSPRELERFVQVTMGDAEWRAKMR